MNWGKGAKAAHPKQTKKADDRDIYTHTNTYTYICTRKKVSGGSVAVECEGHDNNTSSKFCIFSGGKDGNEGDGHAHRSKNAKGGQIECLPKWCADESMVD